jgi:hypothetical protein
MYLVLVALSGCVSFAPPPPIATFDGPATAGRGKWELGLGAGTGVALFPGAHGPGHAWFGRARYGVTDDVDLGIDVLGVDRGDKQSFTGKFAARWNPAPYLRLEVGAGVADDSDGKSANGDIAMIVGTPHREGTWRFYGGPRLATAYGFPGDLVGSGMTAPPPDVIGVITVGASARIDDHLRFVIETGAGALWVEHQSHLGIAHYLGVGLVVHTP